MLFNSYEFLLGFLPVCLAGYYLLGRRSRSWSLSWLILLSAIFYAWWRPFNLLLIAPSIVINYGLARGLVRWRDSRPRAAKAVLVAGIVFNVAFLGYFKYITFFQSALNDVFGLNLVLTHVILPLGVSFITFQKIGFLVDVQAGRIEKFEWWDYCLFVLFFPQLIAGPIVHYREMMPQFLDTSRRFNSTDFTVGSTLFFMGMFKKLVLADPLAPRVATIFADAASGRPISFLSGWLAAIGFTLQIYFDFSGYTDMALGLARFFGVKLPVNFNSPLKATSIIDFWLRWHVSLTRFLTAYLYNPLVLSLTRRRLAAGRTGFGGRNTTFDSYLKLLVLPTVFTMFISGFWHGVGYQFLLWGILHGIYLSINHGWKILRLRFWRGPSYDRVMNPAGFVLTFTSVVAAMVLFRANTVASAFSILRAMIGAHGLTLPLGVLARLGNFGGWLIAHGMGDPASSGANFSTLLGLCTVLLAIAWLGPNTLQILSRYEPALGVKQQTGTVISWRPSAAWAWGMAVVAVAGILSLGELSAFLYWQF